MADLLRKNWLLPHLLELLSTAESTRIPFVAKGFLQARIFHNYRFMDGTKELYPHELISADVSDKYCNIRCSFTRALEARLQKEKGWRLTELRGVILAKATGVLCIMQNSSMNGLSVALEIDSFVPHGDAGGAVYGDPVWFDNLPEVRTMLNRHHVLKLVGRLNADLGDIRSQASEQSSDDDSQRGSSQMFTQPVSAQARTTTGKSIHNEVNRAKRNEVLVKDLEFVTPQNTKRRRLHTGWADFRDLTYYDCQIPPAQQRILDDENCWMPRGDYAIEPIKHKSRKEQITASESGPKQTRLLIENFQQRLEETESCDSINPPGSGDDGDHDSDDNISWAASPEPAAKKERTFVFNADQLDRIRRQQVDHSPPPDSSPSLVGTESSALPVLVSKEEDTSIEAEMPPLSSGRNLKDAPVRTTGSISLANIVLDTRDRVSTALDPAESQHSKRISDSNVAISEQTDFVGNIEASKSSQPSTGSLTPSNVLHPIVMIEEAGRGTDRAGKKSLKQDSAVDETASALQPVSSPQLMSVTNDSSPRSTQELPAPSSLIQSPQPVSRIRTIPWANVSSVTTLEPKPSMRSPCSIGKMVNTAFISPYNIAARRSSQSPRPTLQSSRPWQQTTSYRLAHASPRSLNGIPDASTSSRVLVSHRRPTKAELQRLVYAARVPNHEHSSPLQNSTKQRILHSTLNGAANVVNDTPQRKRADIYDSADARPSKTLMDPISDALNQSPSSPYAQARKSSKVRKFDLSKLQQQNNEGLDVQDLLARHRAAYLRYHRPPPSSQDASMHSPMPVVAATIPSPSRKRKAGEIEETQVVEPPGPDEPNSDDEIFKVHKGSAVPWYDDPDTPLRKILNTTLKARGPEPGWHVTRWRDTLDALDERNKERGV